MIEPRPASTVLVVRDGRDGIELVLGLRPPGGPFGGVWVFPGGAVEDQDVAAVDGLDAAWRVAGLRETWEEVGLAVTDPPDTVVPAGPAPVHERLASIGAAFAHDRMVYLSNWVTPRIVSKRFDTRFYVVAADGELSTSDELTQARWVDPTRALAEHERGDFPMMFPTISHLRYVSGFGDVEALIAEAASLDVIPAVEPRIHEAGDRVELVVENDPRFPLRGRREP